MAADHRGSLATVLLVGGAFLILLLDANGTLPNFFQTLGKNLAALRPAVQTSSATPGTTSKTATKAQAAVPWWKRAENAVTQFNANTIAIVKAQHGGGGGL